MMWYNGSDTARTEEPSGKKGAEQGMDREFSWRTKPDVEKGIRLSGPRIQNNTGVLMIYV